MECRTQLAGGIAAPSTPAPALSPLGDMMAFIARHELAIDHVRIERSGRPIFVRAFDAYDPEDPHALYSCTKTVLGILIGIAIDKGLLDGVDQPVEAFAPPGRPLPRREAPLTLRHLLTMTAGLELAEWDVDFATSARQRDLLGHILSRPQRHEPGACFDYSNGGCHVLCHVLRQATGMTPLAFAQEHLFGPLEVANVRWDADAQTGQAGWSGLRMLAEDFSKIARLYLNGGLWKGRRIVSKGWIHESLTGHVAAEDGQVKYGYLWWIDPRYFMAMGQLGQYLFGVPRYDATVVFYGSLGRDRMSWPRRMMNSFILPALDALPSSCVRADAAVPVSASAGAAAPSAWGAAEEGSLCRGRFQRTAAPTFGFRGPPRMSLEPLKTPGQVAALTTIGGFAVNAFVRSVPSKFDLCDAAEMFRRGLVGCGAADAAVVTTNRPFVLDDGTPAFRTNIEYASGTAGDVTAVIVSAFSGDWLVWVEAHTPGDPADMADIVESLRFAS